MTRKNVRCIIGMKVLKISFPEAFCGEDDVLKSLKFIILAAEDKAVENMYTEGDGLDMKFLIKL